MTRLVVDSLVRHASTSTSERLAGPSLSMMLRLLGAVLAVVAVTAVASPADACIAVGSNYNCDQLDGWRNSGSSYSCCSSGSSCTCQDQEYQDWYNCTSDSCNYNVTSTRTTKSSCSSCGSDYCGSWSGCSYSSTCDESASKSRTCYNRGCSSGSCYSNSYTDTGSCSRNTDGNSCGSTSCGSWSSCSYSSTCDESGTQTRSCTKYECSSGSCGSNSYTDSQSCSRSTSGNDCGSDGWFDTSSSYSCCDGGGACDCQDQEYRDYSCSSGNCSYSFTNTRTTTSNCSSCDDADACTTDSCSSGVCTNTTIDDDNDGYTTCDGDCDDNDASANPGATESCNGVDNDCDGVIDDGVKNTYYADIDGDGFGDSSDTTEACSAPSGYVADDTDCDDADPGANPGATETCDGVDNDCDGVTDNGVKNTYHADTDGDGFGDSSDTTEACSAPSDYVTDDTDCDDADASAYPGAAETCDGVDNDCDGVIDNGVKNTYYADTDGDGFGDSSDTTEACSAPSGYVADDTDCADTDDSIYPEADENCGNDTDDDCDGDVDGDDADCSCTSGETEPCYTASAVTKGVGACTDGTRACIDGVFGDCQGEVTPSDEICNGIDDDCDGEVDNQLTDCTDDELCHADTCYLTCVDSDDCPQGTHCYADPLRCSDDPCSSVECADGERCYRGSCFPECTGDGDCGAGTFCFDGRCASSACDNVSCPVDHTCVSGDCRRRCQVDADCGSQQSCLDNTCVAEGCDAGDCTGDAGDVASDAALDGSDGEPQQPSMQPAGGCTCDSTGGHGTSIWFALLAIVGAVRWRRQRARSRGGQ